MHGYMIYIQSGRCCEFKAINFALCMHACGVNCAIAVSSGSHGLGLPSQLFSQLFFVSTGTTGRNNACICLTAWRKCMLSIVKRGPHAAMQCKVA